MFSDGCDHRINGEMKFYNQIKNDIDIIFDVGTSTDSIFLDFTKCVHYFEPNIESLNILKQKSNNNSISYFNKFGLAKKTETLYYYPKYESFFNRTKSCIIDDDANKIFFETKSSSEYVYENNIQYIDFLKIDTEGYELSVLEGFGNFLENIKIIQFEYGGTYLDANIKLIDIINYLKKYNFNNFSYIRKNGLIPLTNYDDHYQYSNIVCFNL